MGDTENEEIFHVHMLEEICINKCPSMSRHGHCPYTPKAIYRFSVIPTKIWGIFFTDVDKIHTNTKNPEYPKQP